MTASMHEYLERDMECEGLLECFYGLKGLDREVFTLLARNDAPMTVDEVAEEIERERSTAYRSVQRLVEAGVVQKDQVNYDQGGYYHVFQTAGSDEVTDQFQRLLNDWYAKMGTLIGEFDDQYGDGEPNASVEN